MTGLPPGRQIVLISGQHQGAMRDMVPEMMTIRRGTRRGRVEWIICRACDFRDTACSADDVIAGLNKYYWKDVTNTVANGPKQLSASPWGRARYEILDEKPCAECRYKVSLVFEQDDNSQWHWMDLNFPGD